MAHNSFFQINLCLCFKTQYLFIENIDIEKNRVPSLLPPLWKIAELSSCAFVFQKGMCQLFCIDLAFHNEADSDEPIPAQAPEQFWFCCVGHQFCFVFQSFAFAFLHSGMVLAVFYIHSHVCGSKQYITQFLKFLKSLWVLLSCSLICVFAEYPRGTMQQLSHLSVLGCVIFHFDYITFFPFFC